MDWKLDSRINTEKNKLTGTLIYKGSQVAVKSFHFSLFGSIPEAMQALNYWASGYIANYIPRYDTPELINAPMFSTYNFSEN